MFEAHLVVTFTGAAVCDGFGTFFSATSTWYFAITGGPSKYRADTCVRKSPRP